MIQCPAAPWSSTRAVNTTHRCLPPSRRSLLRSLLMILVESMPPLLVVENIVSWRANSGSIARGVSCPSNMPGVCPKPRPISSRRFCRAASASVSTSMQVSVSHCLEHSRTTSVTAITVPPAATAAAAGIPPSMSVMATDKYSNSVSASAPRGLSSFSLSSRSGMPAPPKGCIAFSAIDATFSSSLSLLTSSGCRAPSPLLIPDPAWPVAGAAPCPCVPAFFRTSLPARILPLLPDPCPALAPTRRRACSRLASHSASPCMEAATFVARSCAASCNAWSPWPASRLAGVPGGKTKGLARIWNSRNPHAALILVVIRTASAATRSRPRIPGGMSTCSPSNIQSPTWNPAPAYSAAQSMSNWCSTVITSAAYAVGITSFGAPALLRFAHCACADHSGWCSRITARARWSCLANVSNSGITPSVPLTLYLVRHRRIVTVSSPAGTYRNRSTTSLDCARASLPTSP